MVVVHPQIRVVRLAMVLVIFVLTVFLYASYYASPGLSMSNRIRIVSDPIDDFEAPSVPQATNNELDDRLRSVVAANAAALIADDQQPLAQQLSDDTRSPSIMQTDSENINGSNAQQFSDVSVPSAPAFAQSNASSKSSTSIGQPSTPKGSPNATSAGVAQPKSSTSRAASPPSAPAAASAAAAAPIGPVAAATPAIVHGGNIDTLKGVRTSAIYEPGHSEAGTALCPDGGESLRLMILITSAPTHHDARLSIRQTWGSYATRRDIGIGFILGATQSAAVEDTLAAENFMYGDLIRGHFLDSYNNLTLKTVSSLEWIDEYCPKVPFFLKTDDDMFINVPKLLAFMDKHANDRNVIYGRLAKKWKPIRNKKSKYYVSPQQYFPPVFPAFTTGPAYLMSTDIVHDLYAKALNQTYLKLEDVFTTGIVAQLVNVKRLHVNEFLNRRIAFNPCNIRRVISVHMVKSNEQFDLWKKLLDTGTKCK